MQNIKDLNYKTLKCDHFQTSGTFFILSMVGFAFLSKYANYIFVMPYPITSFPSTNLNLVHTRSGDPKDPMYLKERMFERNGPL